MIRLRVPLKQRDVSRLGVGDRVLLSGTIFTARDKAHLFLLENSFEKIRGGVIYHCGPVIRGKEAVAAGPTTSWRMNRYTPGLIEKYGVRAIIGKGGMDDSVLDALGGKAVYLAAVGGAAVLYADALRVKGVYKSEFGAPEAIWELEAEDFPAIVAMDSRGNSLYKGVQQHSSEAFLKLVGLNKQ